MLFERHAIGALLRSLVFKSAAKHAGALGKIGQLDYNGFFHCESVLFFSATKIQIRLKKT